VSGLDFIEKPNQAQFLNAFRTLLTLGAMGKDGNLTEVGKKMANLPISVIWSKLLISVAGSDEYSA